MVSVALTSGINRLAFLSPTAKKLPSLENTELAGLPAIRGLTSYTLMLAYGDEMRMKPDCLYSPECVEGVFSEVRL
jgi:hypothetical protein